MIDLLSRYEYNEYSSLYFADNKEKLKKILKKYKVYTRRIEDTFNSVKHFTTYL